MSRSNLRWFVAELCREERNIALIRIQAESQQEAEQIAKDFDTSEIMSWDDVAYIENWVESVQPNDGEETYFSAIVEKKSLGDKGVENE